MTLDLDADPRGGVPVTARRPSRAKVRAVCPDCRHEVGAARDFVRTDARRQDQWRLALHKDSAGGRCTGSRMIVPTEDTYPAADEVAS